MGRNNLLVKSKAGVLDTEQGSDSNGSMITGHELQIKVYRAVKSNIDHVKPGQIPGVKVRVLVQQFGNADAGETTEILDGLVERGILSDYGKGIYNAVVRQGSEGYRQLERLIESPEPQTRTHEAQTGLSLYELAREVLGKVLSKINEYQGQDNPTINDRVLSQGLDCTNEKGIHSVLDMLTARGIITITGRGTYSTVKRDSDSHHLLEIMLMSTEIGDGKIITPESISTRLGKNRVDNDLAELYLDSLDGGPVSRENGSYRVRAEYWR